jgi:hypothetical protein
MVTVGNAVKAMVLNGLGFVNQQLYVVTTNLFPPKGIVLGIGSAYAEALFFPR